MAIKPIPRRVSYIERDKKTRSVGKVVAVASVYESYPFGDYQKEIQLIEWDNGKKGIRLAYYVKNHGANEKTYHWGSQTTLILQIQNAKRLFQEGLRLIEESK